MRRGGSEEGEEQIRDDGLITGDKEREFLSSFLPRTSRLNSLRGPSKHLSLSLNQTIFQEFSCIFECTKRFGQRLLQAREVRERGGEEKRKKRKGEKAECEAPHAHSFVISIFLSVLLS